MVKQIKKYIRGNTKRGHEVIAELEKLGGKNILKLKGNEYDKVYYIERYKYTNANTIDFVSEKSFIGQLIVTHPDWEKIELPKIFKDGDVVAATITSGIWIGIFKQYKAMFFESYCSLSTAGEFHSRGFENHRLIGLRFATEEERKKFFKAIKDNGYKWNPQEKTLEKLIVPKFKVGDRIRHRLTGDVYKVLFVLSNGCGGGVYDVAITNEIGKSIDVKEQDDYELVPNKFDINTLVPFESRVLVRDYKSHKWSPAIWGLKTDDIDIDYSYIVVGGIAYCQCIPLEGNEYLLGKYDDCDEYYKTWEE